MARKGIRQRLTQQLKQLCLFPVEELGKVSPRIVRLGRHTVMFEKTLNVDIEVE